MKKSLIFLMIIMAINSNTYCQVYFTKNGTVSFFSKTILEDIRAYNNQVLSVLNIETGRLQFSLLNLAFQFPKAKMEEDFNEEYMESEKFPRSTFNGSISDISKIIFSKDGTWQINVTGELTIHGVTKLMNTSGTLTSRKGFISVSSKFNLLLKDFNIHIPTIVNNKISEIIEITVDCAYEKK